MPFRKLPGTPQRPRAGSLFGQAAAPAAALVAHIDGGARGNPGPAGYGVSIHDADGRLVDELSESIGLTTNNVAEYSGLLAALDYAAAKGHAELKVFSDSELLVRQMNGEYKVRSPELKPLFERARAAISRLKWFQIEHVRREQNSEADALANEAMDRGMRSSFPRGENRNPAANRARRSEEREFRGVVRDGRVELIDADLEEGTRVRVRVEE